MEMRDETEGRQMTSNDITQIVTEDEGSQSFPAIRNTLPWYLGLFDSFDRCGSRGIRLMEISNPGFWSVDCGVASKIGR